MRTVKEVSKLTGISVRTLHHYDAIGLLKPTKLTKAGYRLYDDTALSRLQSILLFRELQFPLKEIKEILDSPGFDPAEALEQQIQLLQLQYQHIGKLISLAREIQKKGVSTMEFQVFDKSEMERYKAEAKARWGDTRAYQEYEQKQESGQKLKGAEDQMMELFAEIGALRELPPERQEVQEKVGALRAFITSHYYNCTREILKELGEMYAGDERFRRSIDQAGGEGTAVFAKRAIEIYCSKE